MRAASATKSALFSALVVSAGLCFEPEPLGAIEIGATHLVFESSTAMKKVAASLYMSVVDRSVGNDKPGNPRRLRCAVAAKGKKGSLPVKGTVALRAQGEASASGVWQGRAHSKPLDGRGEVSFDEEVILGLIDEANRDGVKPTLFSIELDGGKGKKVSEITLDCVHEPTDG